MSEVSDAQAALDRAAAKVREDGPGDGRFNVVPLYETNFRDVPAMLRRLADDIEAGKYGEVREGATVLMGSELEVFGWGQDQDGASTAIMLQAGAMRLIRAVESHGRD